MEDQHNNSGLPIIDWLGDPIKQSVNSVFNDINKAVEAMDIFRKYRGAHFNSIRSTTNQLKILGMSTPVKITDTYYPAYVSTTIYRRLYELDLHSATESVEVIPTSSEETTPTVRADKYVEEHKRVIVLGGPGSGKTTLLRFLAYAHCDKDTFSSTELKTSKFPIFIHLPDLSKSRLSIEAYAITQLKSKTDKYAEAFLQKVFKNGSALILLDSLDEVPQKKKSDIILHVRKFCETYPTCSIVLSCRTADYVEIIENFHEVELAKLTFDAIDKIVRAWFGQEVDKAKRLLRHLKNDETIASLMETPLLLGLLCIQFRHDLSIPTKRKAELFGRCVNALLREWDASRGFRRKSAYENISDERKERIFEHVALHFFERSPKYVFSEDKLVKEIASCIERFEIDPQEAKGILREIESHHGILEKVSMDSFGFSHQSFHEFFAARCVLSRRVDNEIVKKYFEDEEWSSVIEFIIALREDPDELVQYMIKKSQMKVLKTYPAMARRTKNLWLLYRCLSTGPALSSTTYDDCYEHIVSSQVKMAKNYRAGGVVPFAVLMPDGVRHSYYYWRERPTLYKALQPLRQLANTIFAIPSPRYAKRALIQAKEIERRNGEFFEDTSLVLCLVIPLASILPIDVKKILMRLKTRAIKEYSEKFFVNWIDESISNL